ncbi:TniQ family protein [Acetobacterium bakii]|uniref:TniQ family protein n=1 Tax=Acetobacterium bakii TaxID=52689 RepID=UPI0011DF3EF5|nr:TniQ family protein [Acetobacterium bakii]
MITRVKRFPYEALDDYLTKLCFINCCSPITLFKSILKSRSGLEHTVSKYMFSYKDEINLNEFYSFIGEHILLNINSDVQRILGPFSKHLDGNLEYLYKKNFKFCPICMEEGNHYLFHQLTFVDRCLIHKIPLIERCHICNSNYNVYFNFSKYRPYNCPICNNNLQENYFKLSAVELIHHNYQIKPIELNFPISKDLSCLIVDVNPCNTKSKNIFPTAGLAFINSYLISGKITEKADITVLKNNDTTNYNIDFLEKYHLNCDYLNLKKDYSRIDLSALSTIENAVFDVSKIILNSYKVKYLQRNINRTNKNYIIALQNIFYEIIYSDKRISKEQYAFYLWMFSCIFRDKLGRSRPIANVSFLVSLYEQLISFLFECYSNNNKQKIIPASILELAYELIKFYLFEYFTYLLRLIEDNYANPDFIRFMTNNLVEFDIPTGPAFKVIIIENEKSFEIYIFKFDEDIFEFKNVNNDTNSKTLFGGFDLMHRNKMPIIDT